MDRLWHHPESDALFVGPPGDWQETGDGALCNEVSDHREMVERYNRENPGYLLHVWHGPQDHADRNDSETCQACVLSYCMVCRAGECELTTDCPGEPQPEHLRVATCAGYADFWSGVWL